MSIEIRPPIDPSIKKLIDEFIPPGLRILGVEIQNNSGAETWQVYVEGLHPGLGQEHLNGLSGPETIIRRVMIKAIVTFEVHENGKKK